MNRANKNALHEANKQLLRLSDGLFGEASELDSVEAEGLLRKTGIEPDVLTDALYRRFELQAKTYWRKGKPLPSLLKKALEDLRPPTAPPRNERELAREARMVVRRLIERLTRLPDLLLTKPTPPITVAYRNKKEISDRDKTLLDRVSDDLRKRIEDRDKRT